MMLLLWIVDEIINICYDCCWMMLLMTIHAWGVVNCIVVIQVVDCLMNFWWNWLRMKKLDFDEIEWVDEVVRMNYDDRIYDFDHFILNRNRLGKNRVFE